MVGVETLGSEGGVSLSPSQALPQHPQWWDWVLPASLTSKWPMIFQSLFTRTTFFHFTSFLQYGQVFCLGGMRVGGVLAVARKQAAVMCLLSS